jgi:hypothetical protein
MGSCLSCVCSVISSASSYYKLFAQVKPGQVSQVTTAQFQEAHSEGEPADIMAEMKDNYINLAEKVESDILTLGANDVTALDKVLFITCLNYTKPENALGAGPCNDAISIASFMKARGLFVYYLHNPIASLYLQWMKFFLKNTKGYLMCYYTGRGCQVTDTSGDETDNLDEAYVFEDQIVHDDDLLKMLNMGKTNLTLKTVLISECDHSGSVWDCKPGKTTPQVLALASAEDNQLAKKHKVNAKELGMFTFALLKAIEENPSVTPNQLPEILKPTLDKFEQSFVVSTSTNEMLNQKIMP